MFLLRKRLLIVGGKGSGEIAMTVFEDLNNITNEWKIEGYLSDVDKPGKFIGNHKIIGSTYEIQDYVNRGYYIHNALFFNTKDKENRIERFGKLNIPLDANATAIHPRAFINRMTTIGKGTLICPFCATSAAVKIGNFVHAYTNCFIGHDTIVNDYVTIAAHSVVGARINLFKGCHIGLNSTLREDINVGEYSIVGIGAVVLKDVEKKSVVVGNPAHYI